VSSRQRAARRIARPGSAPAGRDKLRGFVSTQRPPRLIHSGAIPSAVGWPSTPLLKETTAPDRRRQSAWRQARLAGRGKGSGSPAQQEASAALHIAVGVMGAAAVNQGGPQDPGGNAQLLARSPENRVWK